MKAFEDYFTENEILRQICKMRVKSAKSKSKRHLLHLLTSNSKYNYHLNVEKIPLNEFEKYQLELNDFLSKILPPRKRWVKLGQSSRQKPGLTNEYLTSNDKNFYSLLKTIKVHEKKKSQEEWFLNLQNFINEIIELANDEYYKISKPLIFPKLKEKLKPKEINECRPICIFNIKDRILLSITNKFLTRLFDDFFQNNSFAFRYKKNSENKTLSHHDCIKEIQDYRIKNKNKKLWVVECDMKKFYDTVNHKIAKSLFDELISKCKKKYPQLNLDSAVKIFESYLECFAFNIDMPKPTDTFYWSSYKIPNGEFSWVDKFISEHYDDIANERIGIPQGGALSGLIANIYLNQADLELVNINVLYQRFCDDMIIISDNLLDCETAKNRYTEVLFRLKLFPHSFKNEKDLVEIKGDVINYKPLWKGKSKGPYCWGKVEDNCFPWIGFVGYEIDYSCNIRVRKKSLKKELSKQHTIIKEIENAVKTGMRRPKGTATESAINRLIGMSVGRIGLDNFEEVSTDMCWKNGFKELTLNKDSIRQIKQLDRNRSKKYYKFLKTVKDPEIKNDKKNRQVIKYNKPFSYYYQILERDNKSNNADL